MQNVPGCGSILDKYFDIDTMSIHIKEKNPILKKNGGPDGRKSVICKETLDKKAVSSLIDQIFLEIEGRDDGVLEIDRSLSKIIQL
jgi:predicted PilT family ATPase